jgi:hypothetical protein
VLSSPLGLALIFIPIVAAALALYAMPSRFTRAARPTALAAALVCLAFLALHASAVAGGARVQASPGNELGGVTLLMRSDPTAVTLALTATIVAVLTLLERNRRRSEVLGVLICLAGTIAAAFAADTLTLFAGVETANIGTLLLCGRARGKVGRGLVAAVGLQHLASLGLLAAAVELQLSQGTTAFAVLPAGAVTAGVAWPWALAGVMRLVGVGLIPIRGAPVAPGIWSALVAVPSGAAILLRLHQIQASGPLPLSTQVLLQVLGVMLAVAGTVLAVRYGRRSWALAGRGLCLGAAGPVIVMSAMPGSASETGLAVGLAFTELAVACSCAWERPGAVPARRVANAGYLCAGALPIGLGTTALTFELGAVAAQGRAGLPVMILLSVAAVACAAAATRLAWYAPAGARAAVWSSPVGLTAIALSVFTAVMPGPATTTISTLLVGSTVARSASAGSILGPGGGWAGGYFLIALALLLMALYAASRLLDVRLPALRTASAEIRSGPLPLMPLRAIRGPIALALQAGDRVDEWLVVQPQLPLIVAGTILGLLLIH